ncbi:MAG: biopolymer transporter ExbD [[Candidatus Thermochlorobacteriaceae] bacterium GBChlB]|nr:MAG: biopolymer transporter ExbD [[Candidatus Thermochlorobacteriaceae] bacterium GBChlB]
MSKVKSKRVGFKLDMTPMVDVAFLLLTFFMLTTQFKPPELAKIDLPNATADRKLPDKDILMVVIGEKSEVFIGVDAQPTREAMFAKTIRKSLESAGLGAGAIEDSLKKFRLAEGTPVRGNDMKQVAENLERLVIDARLSNPSLRPVIKADMNANYETVEMVMQTFKKTNMPTFNLITSMEAKPAE